MNVGLNKSRQDRAARRVDYAVGRVIDFAADLRRCVRHESADLRARWNSLASIVTSVPSLMRIDSIIGQSCLPDYGIDRQDVC